MVGFALSTLTYYIVCVINETQHTPNRETAMKITSAMWTPEKVDSYMKEQGLQGIPCHMGELGTYIVNGDEVTELGVSERGEIVTRESDGCFAVNLAYWVKTGKNLR
jgi:hypothetical protein